MRQRSRESPRLSHAEFTALVDRHQHPLYA
jgi:hypothetical protein